MGPMDTEKMSYHFIPDLGEKISAALEAADKTTPIQGQAIYADSLTKILLFPFAEGQTLREHTTPHQAILHVIRGKGEMTLGDDTKPVQEGSWVMMSPNLPHSISANTKMILLLQVFLKGDAS